MPITEYSITKLAIGYVRSFIVYAVEHAISGLLRRVCMSFSLEQMSHPTGATASRCACALVLWVAFPVTRILATRERAAGACIRRRSDCDVFSWSAASACIRALENIVGFLGGRRIKLVVPRSCLVTPGCFAARYGPWHSDLPRALVPHTGPLP